MNNIYSKILLFLVAFTLISLQLFAHTGSIKGQLTDAATSKPITGASVYIQELNISTETDAFGNFFIKQIEAATYTISISHVGYETITQEIKVDEGVTSELVIPVRKNSVHMDAVTINAKKEETTQSLSTLDIKLRPVDNSQHVLRMVPGLFIAQHQGGGKAEQIFLRGFDIDHGTDVSINVDGMPVNMVSHAHGQGYADLHFVIPELLDNVDFGKGPYRMDKGNFATAGWVDFKTKRYLDNSFVKLEGGSFGYTRSLVGVNLLDDADTKQTAYVAAEYMNNKGFFDAPQNFNRTNIVGKYSNQISDKKLFSVTMSAFRSNWEASGQIPIRAVEQGLISRFGEIDKEFGRTSRYNLNLEYTQKLNNHSSIKTNLYTSYYDFELFSNFTFFLEDPINGDQIKQKESRVITGYNAAYTNEYKVAGLKTQTTVGVGLRYDNVMDNELSHTLDRTTTLETYALGDIYETNLSGYVNQAVYLTPQLVLSGGTRFDYFIHAYDDKRPAEVQNRTTAQTAAFSPKVGLYYNFSNKGRIYFNYGTGFHSNDTRVVTARNGNDVLPLARSYDFGVILKPYSRLLVQAAVFRIDLDQEFVYVGDAAVVELSGKTQRLGADFSARYQMLNWLFADVDVNYTHARSIEAPEGENYIPLAPSFTSIGGLTARFENGLSGSVRYRYMADRAANEDYSTVAEGYNIFDVAAGYAFKRYELGVQVQNVLNTKWREAQFDTETRLPNELAPVSEVCFTPGTPFAIKLSATYKF